MQTVRENIIVRMGDIVNEFEEYIYKLQAIAIKNRHFKDNLICQSVCFFKKGLGRMGFTVLMYSGPRKRNINIFTTRSNNSL